MRTRAVVTGASDGVGLVLARRLAAAGAEVILPLLGTVETAALPALYAATSPDARGGGFYGPDGPGHLGGAPAEQKLYSRLRDADGARRVWRVSEDLVGVGFGTSEDDEVPAPHP